MLLASSAAGEQAQGSANQDLRRKGVGSMQNWSGGWVVEEEAFFLGGSSGRALGVH